MHTARARDLQAPRHLLRQRARDDLRRSLRCLEIFRCLVTSCLLPLWRSSRSTRTLEIFRRLVTFCNVPTHVRRSLQIRPRDLQAPRHLLQIAAVRFVCCILTARDLQAPRHLLQPPPMTEPSCTLSNSRSSGASSPLAAEQFDLTSTRSVSLEIFRRLVTFCNQPKRCRR